MIHPNHCSEQPVFRKCSSVFIHIFAFSIASCSSLKFFTGVIFFLSEGLSLGFLLGQLFWQQSLSFLVVWACLHDAFILGGNLSRHRILGWWIRFQHFKEVMLLPLVFHRFYREVGCHSHYHCLEGDESFFSLLLGFWFSEVLTWCAVSVAFFVFFMLLTLWVLRGWFLLLSFQALPPCHSLSLLLRL